MSQGEFLLYQAENARTYIQVRFQEGGLWLTQQQLAELYQSTPQNITQHIRAIYDTGELREEATCKPYLQVREERGSPVAADDFSWLWLYRHPDCPACPAKSFYLRIKLWN